MNNITLEEAKTIIIQSLPDRQIVGYYEVPQGFIFVATLSILLGGALAGTVHFLVANDGRVSIADPVEYKLGDKQFIRLLP